ncbi:MAG: hypothetical protein LBI99_03245 [Propionibacteriaceae bacterium]|jgi:hypothetical protein|nr:hypothetical protein [Propionibacteriaceae bacterium]
MAFTPIDVNHADLTIMGVRFPDRETLDVAADALGSTMFEGFIPTAELVRLYRAYLAKEVSLSQLPTLVEELA